MTSHLYHLVSVFKLGCVLSERNSALQCFSRVRCQRVFLIAQRKSKQPPLVFNRHSFLNKYRHFISPFSGRQIVNFASSLIKLPAIELQFALCSHAHSAGKSSYQPLLSGEAA